LREIARSERLSEEAGFRITLSEKFSQVEKKMISVCIDIVANTRREPSHLIPSQDLLRRVRLEVLASWAVFIPAIWDGMPTRLAEDTLAAIAHALR